MKSWERQAAGNHLDRIRFVDRYVLYIEANCQFVDL